ncbi:MAG: bifunctional histidinol-phosphatase/imidazoleglycerol-phosphate dehydratase HisB [Pseudomonadota bacterium]|nr:bifunctional histidinol-phosphatase/imidazoleglycerol-phosphate dehydratase HisB [Pseudomonadota bacterium]
MKKVLFIDRDGTLIEEPADFQIDAHDKLRLVAGVIPALIRLRDAGYRFVIVTNQDGLGTASFPQADFDGPHSSMLHIFGSQGLMFDEILIDDSFEHAPSSNRKPATGLVRHWLADDSWSRAQSAMVGDRDTDLEFARNLGVRGFKLDATCNWDGIAHALADAPRRAVVERNTKETRIRVEVDLDRASDPDIATGLGYFDHMLEQLGKHGGFALSLRCDGDLRIDEHHTVEDCALALGMALKQAIGDKRGIARYGFTVPMDESLATAALDLSGRPYFVFSGVFPREHVGELPTELVPHFFHSLCETAGINLHLDVRGDNAHHMVEACFKVVARALRLAITREGNALPSTKGTL